jgi:NADH-quinone oxidoreductase subunit M
MLWMFQRVNYGPVTNEKNAALPDLQPREWLVIAPIIALAVVMGVFPNLFLRPIEPSVVRTLGRIERGTRGGVRAAVSPNLPSSINPSPINQQSAFSNQQLR